LVTMFRWHILSAPFHHSPFWKFFSSSYSFYFLYLVSCQLNLFQKWKCRYVSKYFCFQNKSSILGAGPSKIPKRIFFTLIFCWFLKNIVRNWIDSTSGWGVSIYYWYILGCEEGGAGASWTWWLPTTWPRDDDRVCAHWPQWVRQLSAQQGS
jgi:hypothetical protein